MSKAGSILLVDDDDTARYATARLLHRGGYAVSEAATGVDALAMARHLPQVVLLDLRLPDIDGFEVARRLKGDPASADVPVVHLTAYGRTLPKAAEQSAASGADAILFQPVGYPQLIECVSRVISSRAVPARSIPVARGTTHATAVGASPRAALPGVRAFLEARAGLAFCTSCLGSQLRITPRASREAAWTLEETPGYRVSTAECAECGRRRRVVATTAGRAFAGIDRVAEPPATAPPRGADVWGAPRRVEHAGCTIELLSYRVRDGWRAFATIRNAVGVFVPPAPGLLRELHDSRATADERALQIATEWITARELL